MWEVWHWGNKSRCIYIDSLTPIPMHPELCFSLKKSHTHIQTNPLFAYNVYIYIYTIHNKSTHGRFRDPLSLFIYIYITKMSIFCGIFRPPLSGSSLVYLHFSPDFSRESVQGKSVGKFHCSV